MVQGAVGERGDVAGVVAQGRVIGQGSAGRWCVEVAEGRLDPDGGGPYGVPVTAPKTMTGRLSAGAASLDLAAALLALRDQVIPPTVHVGSVADDCPVDLVTGAPRPARLRTVLVLARGRGGFNSAMVVRSPADPPRGPVPPTRGTTMTALRLDELTRLLQKCAGSDESVDLKGDVLDLTFADLGYDSLAVLAPTGVIEREYHIRLDEGAVPEADTPGATWTWSTRRSPSGAEHPRRGRGAPSHQPGG